MLTSLHCAVLTACVFAADPAAQPVTGFEVEPVVIKMSKETTFLDGPLHKDGTVDYVTALDRINAKGVTKENNAVPLLWRAFGVRWSDERFQEAKAKMLGVSVPSAEDHCLTMFDDLLTIANADSEEAEKSHANLPLHWKATRALFSKDDLAQLKRPAQARSAVADELNSTMGGIKAPWAAKDHPLLIIWLKVNAEPIKLIEEASRMPRFYWPYVGGSNVTVNDIMLPALGYVRSGCRLLYARAMLKIHEGDFEGAWNDYLTICRLGKLLTQELTLISQLVAISIDSLSAQLLLALLQSDKLSLKQIQTMAKQFEDIRFESKSERSIDLMDRCALLDTVGHIRRFGFQFIDQEDTDTKTIPQEVMEKNIKAADMMIDSNEMLRILNAWTDELVATYRKPTTMKRLGAADALNVKLTKIHVNAPSSMAQMIDGTMVFPPEHRRKMATKAISDFLFVKVMTAINQIVSTEELARMRRDMLQVAFSLAMYRADHKTYPMTLAQLEPKYMTKIPMDRFDEKPLRYQRSKDGYLLYSIGPDMKDEGGKEESEDGGIADFVIRMPVTSKK